MSTALIALIDELRKMDKEAEVASVGSNASNSSRRSTRSSTSAMSVRTNDGTAPDNSAAKKIYKSLHGKSYHASEKCRYLKMATSYSVGYVSMDAYRLAAYVLFLLFLYQIYFNLFCLFCL